MLILLITILLSACTSPATNTTQATTPTNPPIQNPELIGTPTTVTTEQPVEITAHKLTETELNEFEAYFQEAMTKAQIPGAAVALVQDGLVIYIKSFGVRELGKVELVTPQTLMLIGSSSKPLTSLMMATLVDDGKVSWNTLAKNILPGFTMGNNELTSRLTFRHMVCACSGWQGDRSDVFFRTHIPAEEIVRSMGDIPATGEFEKVFIYSNQMVAAAGYLAGYAAGGSQDDFWKGYADAMQTRVFDPLDMDRTTLSLEKVQASGNYALPHGKTLDFTYQAMPLSAENFVIPIAPAGGIWSSAEDMAKILLLEMAGGVSAGGQRVVSQENMVRTWEPQIDMGESGVRYALGWMTEAYLGKTLIHHSGNSMGFSSDLAFIPEASLGMVILSNAEGAGSFTDAVRSRFFELAFGQDPAYDDIFKQRLATDRKSVMDFATILLPKYNPQSVTPYLGEYQNVLLGKIQLKDEAGKLMLHTEAFSSALGQYNGLAKPSLFLLDPPFATVVFWRLELNQDETGEPFIALYENDKTQPMLFVKITGQD